MKHNSPSNSSLQPPRGIVMDSKGVGFTTVGLPMSEHFFQATSYRIKKVGSNIVLAFGSQSAFAEETDQEYRLAIEIVFPLEVASRFLYLQNWKLKSVGGKDPFANAVEKSVEKDLVNYTPPKKYKMPSGANFRSFPANFSIMSFSTGQGAIEFFEAPPGTLVEAFFQNAGWRPNSDVRAVLTVILPPVELYHFLLETKELLEPYVADLKNLEVDNV